MQRPAHGSTEGLYDCFEKAMTYIGIEDSWKAKMIGLGCDGMNINLGKQYGL